MKPSTQTAAVANFTDVVHLIAALINQLLPLIISLTILVFLWGIFNFVMSAGSEDKRIEGRNFMIYGIIGLAVMVSVWGLVNILTGTLFGGAVIIPQLQ